jgi:glycolate oxidase
VGSDKRCYLDWMFAPDDLATMHLVREAFDPAGLANPGKIFPTPRSCGESSRRQAAAVSLRPEAALPHGEEQSVGLETLEVF